MVVFSACLEYAEIFVLRVYKASLLTSDTNVWSELRNRWNPVYATYEMSVWMRMDAVQAIEFIPYIHRVMKSAYRWP